MQNNLTKTDREIETIVILGKNKISEKGVVIQPKVNIHQHALKVPLAL